MPYISTEALVGAALIVVLAFGYQYVPKAGSTSSGSKKKNKKKSKAVASKDKDRQKDSIGSDEKGSSAKSNKEKANKQQVLSEKQTTPAASSPAQAEGTDSQPAISFASAAGSTSKPTAGPSKPKTLAEKIAPQPRKSKVDDMLDPEDLPKGHARVMKISQPTSPPPVLAPPIEQKIDKYSDDYASDSDDGTSHTTGGEMDDDGWNVVPRKTKKQAVSLSIGSSGNATTTQGGAEKLPVSTKMQRKNAKKAEAKKAAKAAEEEDRQRRLRMHKKDLEKEKINALYSSKKSSKAGPSAGSKQTSSATLDTNGKLVWD